MNIVKKSILILTIPAILLLPGCKKKAGTGPVVTVSVLPQKYFVSRIAGNTVGINVMIPPGQNPATYEPTVKQMINVAKSAIYFRIGHIPFEKAYMKNLRDINSSMKIIDTSKGVNLIKGSHQHSEEDGHHHSEQSGIDPHIWLSPSAVKIQAAAIFQALLEFSPQNKERYTANYNSFIKDIESLDSVIKKTLQEPKNKKFIVFHPAWSYFAREYGLEQVPIEFEGKNPSPKHVKQIIDIAAKEQINTVFIQKQFPSAHADAIARDIGGSVVPLDPLAPDWIENMKRIAGALKKELE
ncbi:MAG: zinc ABC transporter solute-binding protein [bacterium]|nr:zinc ABC transporter solute-binding protein [bacterium]